MDLATLFGVLLAWGALAQERDYIQPEIDGDGLILLEEARHPVLEQLATSEKFVPNDVRLDVDTERLVILTGPNMAGKSTFLRQNAIMAILAQAGSFVPAEAAHIGVVDRLFKAVADHSAGVDAFDDQTVLAIKVKDGGASAASRRK